MMPSLLILISWISLIYSIGSRAEGNIAILGGCTSRSYSTDKTATVQTLASTTLAPVPPRCSFPSLPVPVAEHMTTLLPTGELLSCGGEINWEKTASCWTTTAGSKSWHHHSPLPHPLAAGTVTSISTGTILLSGGSTTTGSGYTAETWTLSIRGSWIPGPRLMHRSRDAARAGHCAVEWTKGNVLVTGGYDGYSALSLVDEINPVKNWITPELPLKIARYYHGCAVITNGNDNVILVAGGFGIGREVLDSVEMFGLDASHPHWSQISPLPVAMYGLVLVASGTNLSLFGGADKFENTLRAPLILRSTNIDYHGDMKKAEGQWKEASGNINITRIWPSAVLVPSCG